MIDSPTAAQRWRGRAPVPWGLVVAATLLAAGTIALIGPVRTRRPFAIAGVVVLAIALVVSCMSIAWLPGFMLS